jgi:hypothetical protein
MLSISRLRFVGPRMEAIRCTLTLVVSRPILRSERSPHRSSLTPKGLVIRLQLRNPLRTIKEPGNSGSDMWLGRSGRITRHSYDRYRGELDLRLRYVLPTRTYGLIPPVYARRPWFLG